MCTSSSFAGSEGDDEVHWLKNTARRMRRVLLTEAKVDCGWLRNTARRIDGATQKVVLLTEAKCTKIVSRRIDVCEHRYCTLGRSRHLNLSALLMGSNWKKNE